MVLQLGVGKRSLGRLLLPLLCSLLSLVLVVVLLLLLRVPWGRADEWARGVLRWLKCLVFVRVGRVLGGRLLVVRIGRRVLWLQTLAVRAVVVLLVYPALGVITSLRAHPSEWGPIVLVLVRVRRILLLLRKRLSMALKLRIFGRHLWLLVLLLQKGIEVVFVVFVRRCEMRAGPVLPVPLVPLGGSETVLLLLLVFERARIALSHRDAPSNLGLVAILFLVAGEGGTDAAAEALLFGLRLRVCRCGRLGLVGAASGLLEAGRGLRAPLKLVEGVLVERNA